MTPAAPSSGMKLFLDTKARRFVKSAASNVALQTLVLKRRDQVPLEIIFVANNAVVAATTGTTTTVGLKAKFSDANFLAYAAPGTNTLNLNTEPVEAAFSSNPASLPAPHASQYLSPTSPLRFSPALHSSSVHHPWQKPHRCRLPCSGRSVSPPPSTPPPVPPQLLRRRCRQRHRHSGPLRFRHQPTPPSAAATRAAAGSLPPLGPACPSSAVVGAVAEAAARQKN